jgi:hypothetical protein
MTVTDLDLSRLEAFGGRMAGVLNDGMLSLSLSLAHQAARHAGDPPAVD